MPEFFKVVTPEQVFEALAGFSRLAVETVPLDDALGRICGGDIASPEDLPPLPRSTMDGFAVRAADTFGASDSIPAFLDVAGAVVMGRIPDVTIDRNRAVAIPTGGFLPKGADAVVMVEYTSPAGEGAIEVTRPVTAGENVLGTAEDVALGEVVIPAGKRLLPQDIGLLAGLGITQVAVYRRPRAVVISTGDEIVPVTAAPPPGRIRDINAHSIAALVRSSGGEAEMFDSVPDDPALLRAALEKALASADVVALSGGSSVGERDHMVQCRLYAARRSRACARHRDQPRKADADCIGERQAGVRASRASGIGAGGCTGLPCTLYPVSRRGRAEAGPGGRQGKRCAGGIGALGAGARGIRAGENRRQRRGRSARGPSSASRGCCRRS